MVAVNLLKQSGSRMLGTRPAARAIEPAMRDSLDSGAITLDTSGVRRIGVSFFDEALLIFNELVSESGNHDLRLIYRKAPPTESLKNLAANRGLKVFHSADGDWIISQDGLPW